MKSIVRDRFILKLVFAMVVVVIAEAPGSAKRLPVSVTSTLAPLTLAVAPAAVVGGNQATATITLSAPAPTKLEITLRSFNNDVAQFGGAFQAIGTSQLTIPQGNSNATFPIRTFGVLTPTTVRLQATSRADVAETTVTVNPASVKTLVIAPAQVIGGVGATGTVTLDGLAPASTGIVVQLSQVREAGSRTGVVTSDVSPVSIPATANIPPGGS